MHKSLRTYCFRLSTAGYWGINFSEFAKSRLHCYTQLSNSAEIQKQKTLLQSGFKKWRNYIWQLLFC